MTTPLISGNRTVDDVVRAFLERQKQNGGNSPPPSPLPKGAPASAVIAGDYILLRNLRCVGSDNVVFEQYPELRVRKDIVRDTNGSQINHTPYAWIAYFEGKGEFLPSFALSCNIVATLYAAAVERQGSTYTVKNAELKTVFDQYKDKGNGGGWHAQNTVVNWGTSEIIHYPKDSDFPKHGGTENINQQQRTIRRRFNRHGFADKTLEEALKAPNYKTYIQDLTGLADTAALVAAGSYFGKPAKAWISSGNETRAAWLGCDDDYFSLSAYVNLYYDNAARGVRLVAP